MYFEKPQIFCLTSFWSLSALFTHSLTHSLTEVTKDLIDVTLAFKEESLKYLAVLGEVLATAKEKLNNSFLQFSILCIACRKRGKS